MSYIVFARKWRPQNFDEVICQEHITTTLKNAISNDRVAHAYIFTGPRGIGKTSVARIFAKGLNCEKGPAPSPCNKCTSCDSINSGRSMDVIEIDGASNNSVDQVRELRENIKFSPSYGRYKIYIIDEVHMLSLGAFNALLKTLEEPPKHAKFIFATTNPEKVPPTVLSRCQRFDFGRISLKMIISKLAKIVRAEKLDISEDAIFSIAKAAEGSMRDAESILDQLASFCEKKINQEDVITLLGIIEEDRLANIVQMLSKRDTAVLLEEINNLILAGKDLSQFLTGLMDYLRNLMVLKVSSGLSSIIDLPDTHIARLKEEMEHFQIDELLYMFYVFQATANAIKRSEVARFIVEAAFIKLCRRDEMMSLAEIVDRIAQLESDLSMPNSYRVGLAEPRTSDEGRGTRDEGRGTRDEGRRRKDKATDIEAEPKEPEREPIAGTEKGAEPLEMKSDEAIELIPEKVKKYWPQLLEIIKGKKISIASYLLEGDIVKIDNCTVTLGFARKSNFHKEVLEHASNKKFIEDIATSVLGQKVKLEFVTLEEFRASSDERESSSKNNIMEEDLDRKAKKDVFDEPIIQSAIEIFNGKIVRNEGDREGHGR